MKLIDGCHSLKLECALRELGFVDVGWKCVANAGIFVVLPFGLPEDPEGDLLGFQVVKSSRVIRLSDSAKKALDFAITMSNQSSYTRHSGSSGCKSQNNSSALGS